MLEIKKSSSFPKIMEYNDYHQFLRDFYNFKKSQNHHFSFRKFAQLSDIKSSNYLMLVMNNQRNLSSEKARSVARAMKLNRGETQLFVALVKAEQSRTEEEHEQVEKEKKMAIKKIIAKDIPADKAEYLSVWYYSLVRELAFLPDFNLNASWISKKLGGMISVTQAENAIKILINLGLWQIVQDRIQVSDIFLDTGDENRNFDNINVVNIHKQTLLAWTKILEELPKSNRELGLIHIPINDKNIPELKKRIQKFQDEIIGWLQDDKAPTQIIQLGTYLIPVTHKTS